MKILGIKCSGHDTGASLLYEQSGKIELSAISEARLNRSKHSYKYPLLSIKYVLDRFNIKSLDEVDLICIDKHGENWLEKDSQFSRFFAKNLSKHDYDLDMKFNYLIEQSIKFPKEKVFYVNHIDAHAASAYYVSGFSESAVLTIEGGLGFYIGEGNNLKIIDRTGYNGDEYKDGKIISRSGSSIHRSNISNLYDLITSKLGLDKFAAGKTMALAAFRHTVKEENYLNIPKNRHYGFQTDYSELISSLSATVKNFKSSSSDKKDTEILQEYWVNIAREAQTALEEDVLYFARLAYEKSGSKNLALTGGVALSCVTNRKILDLKLFENVFVQPASSDEGIPLGCALWGYHQIKKGEARSKMTNAYLGTPNQTQDLIPILDKYKLNYKKSNSSEVAKFYPKEKLSEEYLADPSTDLEHSEIEVS